MIELKVVKRPARENDRRDIGSTIMRWQDETQPMTRRSANGSVSMPPSGAASGLLHGGPQPAGAIAAAIGLTPAAVTALVDRLEARGLLTRKRSQEDRRKVIIEATARDRPHFGGLLRIDRARRASACSKRSATTSSRRSCAS